VAKTSTTDKQKRIYFTEGDQKLQIPNLIGHHHDSWKEFTSIGIEEIFQVINPIVDYSGQKFELSFRGHQFGEPTMTAQTARDNLATFEAPLSVDIELLNKTTGEVKTQSIFFGNYPWMTEDATFIVDGTEKVVVSQLIQTNGTTFSETANNGSRAFYGAKIAPDRGVWLQLETDTKGVIYVKIDRKRKMPITTLLRSFGIATNDDIKSRFADIDTDEVKFIDNTIDKDDTRTQNEALLEVYQRMRPGELATVENARAFIERTFFDFKHYDYSRVGRYKINRRLGLDTPNDAAHRSFQIDDLIATIREIIRLNNTQEPADDKDSLDNRRVKLVGELVKKQFHVGMLRLQRNILDRMSTVDAVAATPSQLINPKPVLSVVQEFFKKSQLSQLIDQTNPFSELAHKRRLSAAGPGGLTPERAGFEVRDAHPTHYGRICNIETPEGKNVGLVLNLATYAKINDYGFVEAPYIIVRDGKVTDEVVYVDARDEESMIIADASARLNEDGSFAEERVSARIKLIPGQIEARYITHIDAAHKEILGAAASMIPFVEKNRVDRSLMACAMQKQAVPLLRSESPTIGTGVEGVIARSTSQVVTAEGPGEVVKADSVSVVVAYKDGEKEYRLTHFTKTTDDQCYNQRVAVVRGDKVKKGDILIEGASISEGEIALGRNLTVAFMPWRGYNMEDAIIISSRLVEDDTLTSIKIQDFEVEVRDTKLGPEQITSDIPHIKEFDKRHLGEDGIVRVGSEVHNGDILVGKITPKGEQDLSNEERLLRAIFGEKAKDIRDTSVRFHGNNTGKVIDVRIYTQEEAAEKGYNLKNDVIMKIIVYVAEMRKISVGDKLSGRHGNKGVVSCIAPVEDMPFMEDGTPVDVILSSMGVPSRMNIGQLYETHLGLAAKALGYKVAAPSFNGPKDSVVEAELEKAGYNKDGLIQLFDGRTGQPFESKTTVGTMHILKLHHMVDDKIHARSTGPYTMVTQQPLGGRAKAGGQRFGEMEVWALEAYGAATTLQEMLTIKSDDVYGRAKAYTSIIKNEPIQAPKLPEGFNVLVKELQGLGLKVDLLANNPPDDPENTPPDEIGDKQPVAADDEVLESYSEEYVEPTEEELEDEDSGINITSIEDEQGEEI